ncbi:hypothetical protein [Massilia sp. CCM 8734]|uniref:hypothetical protein n=1 Tax=Massilia sp. CCM 8734 TaxID=2609283 RepID=UPI0014245AA0|nr:hypothetical protein [Massilia sp. CCM 8734]NHZ94597.1 hypothetical protein [Massilia sp. CCM 8734]
MSAPTERELMERAAKAVGLRFWPGDAWRDEPTGGGLLLISGLWLWNPITDAGDRYRLAQTLGMNIDFADCCVWKRTATDVIQEFWGAHYEGDDDAHAIVRLAAVIGSAQ